MRRLTNCSAPRTIRRETFLVRQSHLSGGAITQVTIKTGFIVPDGPEELLTEYLCDYPDCPNIATHTLGVVLDLGAAAAVCDEHSSGPPNHD